MPEAFVLSLSAIAGAIFGSFVNVLVTRIPESRSVVQGGSRCPNCLASIAPYDNVPLVSYIALGGKCRRCGWRIPLRYPLTEIACALLFLGAAWRIGISSGRPWFALFAMQASVTLLAVGVIDLETRRIPRTLVWWSLALSFPFGIVLAALESSPSMLATGLGGSLGLGGFLFVVHEINPRWMGFGDVRYGFYLGWVLGLFGLQQVLVGFMLALAIGSLVGFALIILEKTSFGQALPFGPFLSLGAYLAMLWGTDIASWYRRLLASLVGIG